MYMCVCQHACVPYERALSMDCENLSVKDDQLYPNMCIWHVQIRVMAFKCESICEYCYSRV